MECVNEGWIKFDTEKDENRFIYLIRDIAPPVTLQPKTESVTEFADRCRECGKMRKGHWIYKRYGGYPEQGNYHCSECDAIDNRIPTYCPSCGARMIEPQEGSGEECR